MRKASQRRTEIHDVAFELGPELCLLELERAPLLGIPLTFDVIVGDGWRVRDVADVAKLDATPPRLEKSWTRRNRPLLISRRSTTTSSLAKLSHTLLWLQILRVFLARPPGVLFQLDDLPSVEVGEHPVVTDGDLDLVEGPLEAPESVHSNVLVGCARALELVCPLHLLAEKNMGAADTENLGTGVVIPVATFVDKETDGSVNRPTCGDENIDSRYLMCNHTQGRRRRSLSPISSLLQVAKINTTEYPAWDIETGHS